MYLSSASVYQFRELIVENITAEPDNEKRHEFYKEQAVHACIISEILLPEAIRCFVRLLQESRM